MDSTTTGLPVTAPPADWRRLHALGLPAGSVRALLAILIFATCWALLVLRPAREIPDYLRDLLFIIMGHYFASRSRTSSSASADDPGPPPLYLPRGTVRLVLVAGTLAAGAVLYRRGQLTDLEANPGVFTLILVAGFLLGVGLSALAGRWRALGHRPWRLIEDVRALASIAAALLLVGLIANRIAPAVPVERIDALMAGWVRLGRYGPEHVLAAVVGFYFGSRS